MLIFALSKKGNEQAMQKLVQHINSFVTISQKEANEIQKYFHQRKYDKGTVLIERNCICDKLYFINSGYLRTFYYREKKDITSWIYSQGEWASIARSFYTEKPSNEGIEAITDVDVCYIEKSDLEHFYQIPKMNEFGRRMMQNLFAELDEIYQETFITTAEEKYNYLAQTRSDLIKDVNLGYVASLLGIRQETLSRIRNKK